MPSTAGKVLPQGCSVWPAFWTVGPNWPNSGEIDIIEYVNKATSDATTLHTNSGCDMFSSSTAFNGTWGTKNCDTNAAGQSSNAGCSIRGKAPVGATFNAQNGGGVYVTQWDNNQYIRVWYFPRDQVPQDLQNKNPNPSSWGLPYARFDIGSLNGNCPSSHFQNHNIIFDTTFCGDWAGSVFGQCSSQITCSDFVRQNPSEFTETYWLINYVDIYDFDTPASAPSVLPTSLNVNSTFAPSGTPVTKVPTNVPTFKPTGTPITKTPTIAPTFKITKVPITNAPVIAPSIKPTGRPTTIKPTVRPTTKAPIKDPTFKPTRIPNTKAPIKAPTFKPSVRPHTKAPNPNNNPAAKPTSTPV